MPKYTSGVTNFWKEKQGGHIIFDDQNVGSHKMTIDFRFVCLICSKKTDFNTTLACLGDKVYRWGGVV